MTRRPTPQGIARRLLRARRRPEHEAAFAKTIRQIPRGKVATYGQVAAASGFPLYHRQVAQFLRGSAGQLPWQRVVGAGGAIKLRREAGQEQRLRLEFEGVRFRGKRVDMAAHQFAFRVWDME